MKNLLLILAFLLNYSEVCLSQANQNPETLLTPEFHKGRREAFRKMMPENSIAIIFAYSERKFSNDVDYFYQPNPDLYYLTGYKEPNSVLILYKDTQTKDGAAYNELLFCQDKDPFKERWDGRRLGIEGSQKVSGIAKVFENKSFASYDLELAKFSMIIRDDVPVDIMNKNSDHDLFAMTQSFKTKLPTDKTDDPEMRKWYKFISSNMSYDRIQLFTENYLKKAPENVQKDPLVAELMSQPEVNRFDEIKKIMSMPKNGVDMYNHITNTLRKIKTPEEIEVLKKAIWISGMGHNEIMKASYNDMTEHEAHGIFSYVFRFYGAENVGYHPIVAAGENGTILHYITNDKKQNQNELLLMDVGAQYFGYGGDITRTIPISGKFSKEQKIIYNIVHDALEEVKKLCKPGTSFSAINVKARDVVADGLLKHGLIKNKAEVSKYLPHGCSHHLGLDVHDKGDYDVLEKNMVVTLEPGCYIPQGSPLDKKWWSIAVRIEDNILITDDGYENLSKICPTKADEVEKMMQQESGFNKMKLPGYK